MIENKEDNKEEKINNSEKKTKPIEVEKKKVKRKAIIIEDVEKRIKKIPSIIKDKNIIEENNNIFEQKEKIPSLFEDEFNISNLNPNSIYDNQELKNPIIFFSTNKQIKQNSLLNKNIETRKRKNKSTTIKKK